MGIKIYNSLPTYIKNESNNTKKILISPEELPLWELILFTGRILQLLQDEVVINEVHISIS